jgi:hypothetical protein
LGEGARARLRGPVLTVHFALAEQFSLFARSQVAKIPE